MVLPWKVSSSDGSHHTSDEIRKHRKGGKARQMQNDNIGRFAVGFSASKHSVEPWDPACYKWLFPGTVTSSAKTGHFNSDFFNRL